MMSQKNYSEDKIIDVIIKILDTRQDIKKNSLLMKNIIDQTLKNKTVRSAIAALREMPEGPELDDNTANYMLRKIINMLAVITKVIDNFAVAGPAVL